MLRSMLMVIFLGVGSFGFSKELPQLPQELLECQGESLAYWGQGYANLLERQPLRALENFQRSIAVVNRQDDSACVVSFMVSFGEAVTYDILGSRAKCKQALGSLLLAANEYGEEEEEETADEEGMEILRRLANLAPSPDVRKLLIALIDE